MNAKKKVMYMAEETHPAIIDIDTFQKAQALIAALDDAAKGKAKPERTAFSGKVMCGNCGDTYKRRTSKTGKSWNCRTYVVQGKSFCPGCSIKEEQLFSIADTVSGEIDKIIVKEHELTFILTDGTKEKRSWQKPSRKDSWTEEMKKQAQIDGRKAKHHG